MDDDRLGGMPEMILLRMEWVERGRRGMRRNWLELKVKRSSIMETNLKQEIMLCYVS